MTLPSLLDYFNSPWWLLLLLLIPVIWAASFNSLRGLGPVRQFTALSLRSLGVLLLVFCLAEIQYLRVSDKMTVIYLLDQSESIPSDQRRAMLDYVIKEVSLHRDARREDLAGLIVFGREAAIEMPPLDADIQVAGKLETLIDLQQDATNLAAAMKLAQATFPEDAAKRLVIVTDGNENIGDARAVARLLVREGVGIDVVPIAIGARAEVAVEKVTLPEDIRKGQPLQANIVVNNMTQATEANPSGEVEGILRLVRRAGGHEETLEESPVILSPGKNVFQSRVHEIDRSQFFTYEARFEPKDRTQDTLGQNNRASAFVNVRGEGRVLLITDDRPESKDDFKKLVDLLERKEIAVDVKPSTGAFSNLADLQAYDSVILANVPRSNPESLDGVTKIDKFFSDDQISALVRNTQQMGAGLVMLGGERSFGAGDWAGTELEEAMPVNFTIKNRKIRGVGALVMLMHACEMPQGNHWEKVVAKQAVQGLGSMDYCGLLQWNDLKGRDDWLWSDDAGDGLIRVQGKKQRMINLIGRMSPGDMPQFEPSMKKALNAFLACKDATTKHMIIISDGDPSKANAATMRQYANPPAGPPIQISTVAIGTHGPAASAYLQRMATQTGGKYYVVTDPKALPRIYQREVRRVARPLVYERAVVPEVIYRHEMLSGINTEALPVIKGYVHTELKENPLVEVSIRADQPSGSPQNASILASWTYGLGRTVAWTTDVGTRWAGSVESAPYYEQLFSQMIEWSMRPRFEEGTFSIASDVKDGQVRVVVSALDKEDQFLNFIKEFNAQVVDVSTMESFTVPVEQIAPGRYIGSFPADKAGSYLVNVSGKVPASEPDENGEKKDKTFHLQTGVNVPYSAEYRNEETNQALLEMLSQLEPNGGEPGLVIGGKMQRGNLDDLLQIDTFRHNLAKAVSSNDIWHYVVVIFACVFLADVFIRRVQISREWFAPVAAFFNQFILRKEEQQQDDRIARLKSRKEQATTSYDERRASARFEPQPDADVNLSALDESAAPAVPPPEAARQAQQVTPGEAAEETYTERLLKAKQKAKRDRS